MQLGISSFGIGIGPVETVALALDAEAAGFARFMLVERVFTNDSVAMCAALAAATTTIGLGTGIANVYLRRPEMLAATSLVAAEVSGGRFTLGLGPNNQAAMARVGIEWRGARESLSETTSALRAILDGSAAGVGPCSVPLPIVWAAVALETAELAGREADGVMLYLATDQRIDTVLERFERGVAASARSDGTALERSLLLPTFLHDDVGAARTAARSFLSMYAGLAHYQKMFRASGFEAEAGAAEAATAAGDAEGRAAAVSDRLIDAIVLAGPAAHCRARLAELRERGLSHVDLAPLPVGDETLPAAAARCFAAFGSAQADREEQVR